MNTLLNNTHHILIEMQYDCDCRFAGTWLLKVAEAQSFWSETLEDPAFEGSASALCWSHDPWLERAALEALSALKRTNSPFHSGKASHVLAVDLEFSGVEFAAMIELGFFVLVDQTYQMTVPASATAEQVRRAASKIASTKADGEIVQPARLLRTLPQAEAVQVAVGRVI